MTEVATTNRRLTTDELRSIGNGTTIAELFGTAQPVVNLSDEMGSGFTVLDDKQDLVNRPFVIVDWHFSIGDKGEFVSMLVVTKNNDKLVVNDGSTGIRDQVHDIISRGLSYPILVERGLRVSEYWFDDDNRAADAPKYKSEAAAIEAGATKPAKARTYYLAY